MWKRVLPKEHKKKEKQVGKYTYNWCEHHMAWTVHKPSDCKLGKKHKDDQKKDRNKANLPLLPQRPLPSTLTTRPSWPLW